MGQDPLSGLAVPIPQESSSQRVNYAILKSSSKNQSFRANHFMLDQPAHRSSSLHLTIRTVAASRFFAKSCSQMRITRQPFARNVRLTSRSRTRFFPSFASQNSRFPAGIRQCFGQLCQKQPSINTASRSLRKTKSGFPNNATFLRHPVIPCARKIPIVRNSVSLFPFPRMRDITALRFSGVKTSGIQ